jgi:hypothetical protein
MGGAGIFFLAPNRCGQWHALLGKDMGAQKWSDFGGSKEGTENPHQTAAREAFEETFGFFGPLESYANMLKKSHVVNSQNEHDYNMFVVKLNQVCSVRHTNNILRFLKTCSTNACCPDGSWEMDEMAWFPLESLGGMKNALHPRVAHVLTLTTP